MMSFKTVGSALLAAAAVFGAAAAALRTSGGRDYLFGFRLTHREAYSWAYRRLGQPDLEAPRYCEWVCGPDGRWLPVELRVRFTDMVDKVDYAEVEKPSENTNFFEMSQLGADPVRISRKSEHIYRLILTFTPDGQREFTAFAKKFPGRGLAIEIDGKVRSIGIMPKDGELRTIAIDGRFSKEECDDIIRHFEVLRPYWEAVAKSKKIKIKVESEP